MRLFALLPVMVAIVWTAPVQQETLNNNPVVDAPGVNKQNILVKRADEMIMFGNQQNAPKVKKSDPHVPILPDLKGNVRALPPHQIPAEEERLHAENKQEEAHTKDTEMQNEAMGELMSQQKQGEHNPISDMALESSADTDSNNDNIDGEVKFIEDTHPIHDNYMGADNLKEAKYETDSDTSKASEDDPGQDKSDESTSLERDYLYDYLDNWYDDVLDKEYKVHRKYPYYNYDLLLDDRQKRSTAEETFKSDKMEVKRSHRAKRDLLFPGPEGPLFNSVYFPETDLDDNEYNSGPYRYESSPSNSGPYRYESSPSNSEITKAYLALLENNNVDSAVPSSPSSDIGDEWAEDSDTWGDVIPSYDIQPIVYNGQSGYFVPVKRQNTPLTVVPGERKRMASFYPFSEEPQTHWGAFLANKRDADYYENYEKAYERLLQLAQVLGMAREPEDNYDDSFGNYERS